jgi:hypothetical protein
MHHTRTWSLMASMRAALMAVCTILAPMPLKKPAKPSSVAMRRTASAVPPYLRGQHRPAGSQRRCGMDHWDEARVGAGARVPGHDTCLFSASVCLLIACSRDLMVIMG